MDGLFRLLSRKSSETVHMNRFHTSSGPVSIIFRLDLIHWICFVKWLKICWIWIMCCHQNFRLCSIKYSRIPASKKCAFSSLCAVQFDVVCWWALYHFVSLCITIETNFNAFKTHWHASLQILQNINTSHQHWKKLHWLPIKQRIDYKLCLLTYKTLTNQQPTYLYNSLSFPSHSVSTRSSDSLVLSIPYVRSSLGKRAFSVIGPRLWNSLPPDTQNSNSLPTFRSRLKTHLFKIAFPSLGSFPSPWTVYPDFDSCYSHFMPYRMTPSVRHRAIEVHYYYYYYYVSSETRIIGSGF